MSGSRSRRSRGATETAADSGSKPAIRSWLKLTLGIVVVAVVVLLGYQGWQSGRATFLRGNYLAARLARNWGEAERLALEWASFDPMLADPLIVAAEAAMEQGNFAAAGDYLNALPEV